MKRSNALVRAVESVFMPALLRILGPRPGAPRRPEPEGPHRALVCKWCCLGDAVVSLYALREFKRRHPDVILDALVSARIADVYRRAPEIREVHVLPLTGRRLALELISPALWLRLTQKLLGLRRAHYAQIIDLELYRGTGPLLKRLLGIPFSRGFDVEGAPPKHHDFEVPLPRRMPEWQCFYRVLGLEVPEGDPPPLYPAPGTRGKVRTGARIGIVFGSSFNWPEKKWPWEKFADLAAQLAREGHACVLLGAHGEEAEGDRIRQASGGAAENLAGRLDYQGLLREVSACDAVVGNDTGALHVAAACGVPTVTLFGPTDPRKWNPIGSTPIFLHDVPCRPCYYLGTMPPCSHFSCLRKMETPRVAEAVREALAQGRTVPAAGGTEDPRARKAQQD